MIPLHYSFVKSGRCNQGGIKIEVDLSASFGGIKIKNPILGGTSPVTQIPEICERGTVVGSLQ